LKNCFFGSVLHVEDVLLFINGQALTNFRTSIPAFRRRVTLPEQKELTPGPHFFLNLFSTKVLS
jgi:hypothetical protein